MTPAGDTHERLSDAAEMYIQNHPLDYPGFASIIEIRWAKRVTPAPEVEGIKLVLEGIPEGLEQRGLVLSRGGFTYGRVKVLGGAVYPPEGIAVNSQSVDGGSLRYCASPDELFPDPEAIPEEGVNLWELGSVSYTAAGDPAMPGESKRFLVMAGSTAGDAKARAEYNGDSSEIGIFISPNRIEIFPEAINMGHPDDPEPPSAITLTLVEDTAAGSSGAVFTGSAAADGMTQVDLRFAAALTFVSDDLRTMTLKLAAAPGAEPAALVIATEVRCRYNNRQKKSQMVLAAGLPALRMYVESESPQWITGVPRYAALGDAHRTRPVIVGHHLTNLIAVELFGPRAWRALPLRFDATVGAPPGEVEYNTAPDVGPWETFALGTTLDLPRGAWLPPDFQLYESFVWRGAVPGDVTFSFAPVMPWGPPGAVVTKATTVVDIDVAVYDIEPNADYWTEKFVVNWEDHFVKPVKCHDMVLICAVAPDTEEIRNNITWRTSVNVTLTSPAIEQDRMTVRLPGERPERIPIDVLIGNERCKSVTAWILEAELTVQIGKDETIDEGNDAAALGKGRQWPPDAGGGNTLGEIDVETHPSLEFGYTAGRVQVKAVLEPLGIESIVPVNRWGIVRKRSNISWVNAGHYELGEPDDPFVWKEGPRTREFNVDDTSESDTMDLDPTSGSSLGELYDLDVPACPAGMPHTAEMYATFLQYVTVKLNRIVILCSDEALWSYEARINKDKAENRVEVNKLRLEWIELPETPHYQKR